MAAIPIDSRGSMVSLIVSLKSVQVEAAGSNTCRSFRNCPATAPAHHTPPPTSQQADVNRSA
eukprot:2249236-Rhodomonas_salina.2